ncbi:MAG: hypothetical protein B1H08_03260 [Candidatus Omnitrophica bacterium 4484_171]|nr:MAG: hypothetical protein B1H08_03260 [Candidatus Omnitrophica bacterium 4484_171]
MKKLVVFVSILFVLPWSVFAAVDSVKVSGDITSQAVTRDLSLGAASSGDSSDFLTMQARVRFDAALTEGVSAVVQFINERLWGAEGVSNTDIDLDLAYLQIKEFLTPAATLIVGRQNLHYGSGLIVGDPDTNQTASGAVPAAVMSDLSLRKSFDAARLILDYSPYIVDLVYAKVAEGTANIDDDVTLFGFNVSYAWNSYNGLTDFYFFGSENAPNITVQDEKSKTYVIGTRTQFTPNDHLGVSLEGAYQFGDRRNSSTSHQHLNAYAIGAGADYKFLDEHNSFEDQSAGEIANILFANSNYQLFNIHGSFMPREDLTLGALYSKLYLAEKIPSSVAASYSPSVGPASGNTYVIKNSNKDLGDEIDLYAVYDYTEDVQFKLTSACFIPGSWFSSVNDDTAYSFKGSVKVAF